MVSHGPTLFHPHTWSHIVSSTHIYLVDICMGLKRVHFLLLLFVRLLKHTYLLKTHARSFEFYHSNLKTHACSKAKTARRSTNTLTTDSPKREYTRWKGLVFFTNACMHACMHTYIHTYIHMHRYPYVHTYSLMYANIYQHRL